MVKEEKKGKSRGFKIFWAVFVVFLAMIFAAILRYVMAYNGFLDKITARKPEMKAYSVIVEKKSELQDVSGLKKKSVGFIKTDEKAANAAQELEDAVKEVTDSGFEADFYEDVDTMTEALKTDITDAIVLETDRMEMMKEESSDFEDDTKVIYTFEIELEADNMEISDKKITQEPFVLYISGSDSRTGIKTTARSDVNIVAAVNPKEGKILLVSIPRDTYVQLHDTVGIKDKLTHAGVYGINMSKTTIEDFLGVDIDYTLKVSFDTVVKTVDELDGIDIESDQELHLKAENGEMCDFVVGKQHVDGPCALRFARERKSYQTGDRHRGQNQQQVITSIIGRLSSSKDYLLRIPTILDIAADSFETTISRDNVSEFIRMQLTQGVKWKVESIAVDGTGTYEPTYSMGANRPLYVMIPSEASVKNATEKIKSYLKNEEAE